MTQMTQRRTTTGTKGEGKGDGNGGNQGNGKKATDATADGRGFRDGYDVSPQVATDAAALRATRGPGGPAGRCHGLRLRVAWPGRSRLMLRRTRRASATACRASAIGMGS
jgi:hypothetical protein